MKSDERIIQVIEYMFTLCRQIACEQIHSRINQQLIAGHFGHEGLRGRNLLQLFVAVYLDQSLSKLLKVLYSCMLAVFSHCRKLTMSCAKWTYICLF